MIRKHVDLIAIALLLTCFGFCAHLQSVFVHGIRSSRTGPARIALSRLPHAHSGRSPDPFCPRLATLYLNDCSAKHRKIF